MGFQKTILVHIELFHGVQWKLIDRVLYNKEHLTVTTETTAEPIVFKCSLL